MTYENLGYISLHLALSAQSEIEKIFIFISRRFTNKLAYCI